MPLQQPEAQGGEDEQAAKLCCNLGGKRILATGVYIVRKQRLVRNWDH